MSFQKSVTPLQIKLRRSRILAGFILLTHSGAIILLMLSTPLWMGLLISVGVVYSLGNALKQHVLMHGQNSITELIWDINGKWRLLAQDGKRLNVRLLGSTYLHTRIVVLNFDVDGSKRSFILLPDALDPDTFRKLRVRLQIEKHEG